VYPIDRNTVNPVTWNNEFDTGIKSIDEQNFAYEEELFKWYDYPDAEDHKKEHSNASL
jgi:hemerythrin